MEWDLEEPEALTVARLMLAAPEFVYEQVKFYGTHTENYWDVKPKMESALFKRNDQLINLALAHYSIDHHLVEKIYESVSPCNTIDQDRYYSRGLRIACLANRNMSSTRWPNFDLNALFQQGAPDEVEALLLNPSIPPNILIQLYEKTDYFKVLSETAWIKMIHVSSKNEALGDNSNRFLALIRRGVFSFLENASVNADSTYVCYQLLDALGPEGTTLHEDNSHVIARWQETELLDSKGVEIGGNLTNLSMRTELCCLIAILFPAFPLDRNHKRPVWGSSDDLDVKSRCLFYAGNDLSGRQIEIGYQKDRAVFLFAFLKNRTHVMRNEGTRKLLETLLEGHGHSLTAQYRRNCKRRREVERLKLLHEPEWREFPEIPDTVMINQNDLIQSLVYQNRELTVRFAQFQKAAGITLIVLLAALYFSRSLY